MRPWLLLVLLAPLAQAYDEAEAPALRDDVVAVWHEPAVPEPGAQWQGFIRFQPGHNVTDVRYQICRVGDVCFAGPTLAQRLDDETWHFNTTDYKSGKNPVAWGVNYDASEPAVWRIGVQYFLYFDGQEPTPQNGTLFPAGIKELPPEPCDRACYVEWSETHYLAFDMPARDFDDAEAPGWGLGATLVVLAVAALRRR